MPKPALSPEIAAKVEAAPAAIAELSPEKQERVAVFLEQLAAEPEAPAALDSAAVAAAYDALDADGQDRITMVLARQAERMAAQQA